MSIHRVQSGLIFDDNFETLDTRWIVSPSDSYDYSEVDKRLTLNHNPTDRSTNALFSLPQNESELLIQVHANYNPQYLGDEGGLVIWKNALEKVEFLESEDSVQSGAYNIWRAVKRQNLWTFFAEKNKAWELFDSTICIDPSMAGVVLKGTPRTGYTPLSIDRVILCRGTHISIGNVSSMCKVELLDADSMSPVSKQIVPQGYSGIDIELPSVPFKGKINIYDKDGNGNYVLVDEQAEVAEMYGGDVFLRGTDLKVSWKGHDLSEINPTNIGPLKNEINEQKMTIINDTTGNIAENVRISIAAYGEEFGWEWCDLAPDNSGTPGTYEDSSLTVGTLAAGESKDFWVRVAKSTAAVDEDIKQSMRPTHFFLEINND
ncbi:hypothetical protein [Bacillus tequilensis]|uniref:hypothetical protein n=1 Tax=Bacillus tequilensis TaxID=227866 RepID=UPI0004654C47|nr:hypothetical protein [Bacillus tequilensis]MDR4436153.1 hypothetical protein [Bacillus tequilensis]SPT93257.1 Virion structural protein [Bacillus tequilensis]